MTANEFRRLALGLPEALEGAHRGHADFRARGRIFATLGPDEDCGMVKLATDHQTSLVGADPDVFQPASGAWGRGGAAIVRLCNADETSTSSCLAPGATDGRVV